jgi:hypothetical protein
MTMTYSDTPADVRVGDTVRVLLPASEVCMHLRVAGTIRAVRIEPGGQYGPYAQILNEHGGPFSLGILMSEAGFYHDPVRDAERDWYSGWYYYPPEPERPRLRLVAGAA